MEELAIFWWNPVLKKNEGLFHWPLINNEVKKRVLEQLDKTVSIYDRSGIFFEFEKSFSEYHSLKHSLLFNSWTSAIFAMFEALNLHPGDEVICPTYTFFASVSPILYTGVVPVFCDCDEHGNINVLDIEKQISNKTKAILITHMRWIPCEMEPILFLCKKYNLKLLEDCSHAHGAKYKWKLVWTFWDMAAWSIQWAKIISWWEWWVFASNNDEYYYRALLLGHYNKRCKQEIPENSPLFQYSTTGFGQKFRAHPLAITIANYHLEHLDSFLSFKNKYAKKIEKELSSVSFLSCPKIENRFPSWYSFIIRYHKEEANNIPLEIFVDILHSEWLVEVDIPTSTQPIHLLPLFCHLHKLKPFLYWRVLQSNDNYKNALFFNQSVLKMPVWATNEDVDKMEKYLIWFRKVIYHINNNYKKIKSFYSLN